jgi:hypothetical protein
VTTQEPAPREQGLARIQFTRKLSIGLECAVRSVTILQAYMPTISVSLSAIGFCSCRRSCLHERSLTEKGQGSRLALWTNYGDMQCRLVLIGVKTGPRQDPRLTRIASRRHVDRYGHTSAYYDEYAPAITFSQCTGFIQAIFLDYLVKNNGRHTCAA